MSFVHLHNHSHYSILSALGQPKAYIEAAKNLGMTAIAITDSGVTYGMIELYQAAKKNGIKPILGVEVYVAPLGHQNKTPENRYSSLVLLAKTTEGYHNLLKLCSIAALEGFYYKPRVDDELLATYSKGLIALSGSLHGVVPKAILDNDLPAARTAITTYQSIFGKENFYLELQHHPEIANWTIVNGKLLELSKELGAPVVAANDTHYIRPEDAEAHDVLLCIQNQKTVHDEHRMRLLGNYSLRSEEEMVEAFRFCPEAIENTLKIAEECNVEIKFGENKMPHFDTGKESPEDYLAKLCEEGLKKRYGEELPEAAKERLTYELEMIRKMGFATYFLIVHDFISYAKQQGIIVGPGRGSAAGSIIAFCLGITDLDPLKFGLLFERFLNPERVSMPDIDIDFADTRRDEVLAYVTNKYGSDRVAQIITYGTLAPKAAIRDAGRALGYSYSEVDAIAKSVPDAILGKYAPLEESIKDDPALSHLYKEDPKAREILDTAQKLEGTIRQVGTHACAVIIARDPLTEDTALQTAAGAKEGIVTQYSMKPCEELGLLKMDFLGLKNLTIMETTLGILKRTHPEFQLKLDELPLDDPDAYALLQKGDTTGVFQLESAGMKRYLKELKPNEFGDIIAMVSLYRPGPMQFISDYIKGKHGEKVVSYLHESLEPILKETYGIAIYQEQILEIAKQFAGFTLGEADLLRRAIGKKIASELAAQREKFIQGAVSVGNTEALAVKMFDEVIEPFAGYGFNKSHAACYALIAYQTAYLKAHYSAEFMAALLTSDADNTDRIVIEIEECRNMNIDVLPPDVNESLAHFTVIDQKTIRFGLTAIKGIGEGPVRDLIAAREKEGPFTNLENFAKRVPSKILNKKTLESLAFSGAMDALGERAQLATSYEAISTYAKNYQNSVSEGQTDIFGMLETTESPELKLESIPPAAASQRLKWEKEFLGLYVGGHPLQGLSNYLARKGSLIRDLSPAKSQKLVSVIGLVTQVKRVMTKKGLYMCFGELEDTTAKLPFILFPKNYNEFGPLIEEDKLLRFEGRLTERTGEFQLVIETAKPLSLEKMIASAKEENIYDSEHKMVGVARFEVPTEIDLLTLHVDKSESKEELPEIKKILEQNKGVTPVEIQIHAEGTLERIKVPFGVDVNQELKSALEKYLVAKK